MQYQQISDYKIQLPTHNKSYTPFQVEKFQDWKKFDETDFNETSLSTVIRVLFKTISRLQPKLTNLKSTTSVCEIAQNLMT